MGVTSGLTHVVEAIVETIQGIFLAIIHMFQFVFNSIMSLFAGFVNFVEGTLGFAIRKSFLPVLSSSPTITTRA
jgi:hypothetical protein